VISSQPADRQAQLSISLQGLMSDVHRNLEPKNRDKFTQAGFSSIALIRLL
jgi:exportin-7